jgi:hypothetical protein
MRKSLLTILLITLSSSAAALWKCTDAGGVVHYLPEAVTDGSKTCIALVADEAKSSEPQQADSQQTFQQALTAAEKCGVVLVSDQEIGVLVGKMTLNAHEKVTPAMLALNRKATPKERKAIEKYILGERRCANDFFQATKMPPLDMNDTALQQEERLRDGQITFADYARGEVKAQKETERIIKAQKETERIIKDIEAKERQVAEQERRRQEELNRPITLSCIVDMQAISGNIPRIGIEWQYQINEAAKTIWASRGVAPTEIGIGPTEISFEQGDQSVSISRNTGRIFLIGGGLLGTGYCQTITQRKF